MQIGMVQASSLFLFSFSSPFPPFYALAPLIALIPS